MISDAYRDQVRLLVHVLPLVAEESCFALKGGTAINLFVRDMPRLSVDIDLTYLPIEDRKASLASIEAALLRIKARIERAIPRGRVTPVRTKNESALVRLTVRDATGAQIKIEVTPVLRGSVYPPETRRVTPRVEEAYGFAEMQVVSFGDLYGGKLVAALDRQHPRDLFDVRELLRNEGIDGALRAAFATYLISHDRPMAEILVGKAKPLAQEFERGFAGMAEESVTLEDLQAAYVALIDRAVRQMPLKHRALLLSVERGEPDWALLGLNGVEDLPAVKWRLFNIRGLTPGRRAANVEALAAALGTDR